jgi:hypothetical protein
LLVISRELGGNVDGVVETGRLSQRLHLLRAIAVTLLGLGLIGAGLAAVFTRKADVGSAALITLGSVLVLFVAVGDRLESLKYGDVELVLRREATQAQRRGDAATARALERAADTIGQRIETTARSYRAVRGSMPSGPERTAKMDEIIEEAHHDAYAPDLNEHEVLELLWTGSEGERVWALGVLQQRPELATPRAVLEAVGRPDQMFDLYQALVLADRFLTLPTTGTWARSRIRDAVRAHLESGAIGDGTARQRMALQVLEHADQFNARWDSVSSPESDTASPSEEP